MSAVPASAQDLQFTMDVWTYSARVRQLSVVHAQAVRELMQSGLGSKRFTCDSLFDLNLVNKRALIRALSLPLTHVLLI